MKSLHDLTASLLFEEASKLSINDVLYDIHTIERRARDEGLRFITVTLADFGKSILTSIESGNLNHKNFCGFHRRSRGSLLPAFLQGWTRHIFDDSGRVLPSVSVPHLRSLRLICQFMSKVKFPFTPKQEADNERKFLETDSQLATCTIPESDLYLYRAISRIILHDLAPDVWNRSEFLDSLHFQHGPGAVAEKSVHGSQKYDDMYRTWNSDLNDLIPYDEYACSNYRELCHSSSSLSTTITEISHIDDRREKGKGRIVFVPKTCKGPRVIGIEPTSHQYVQQGLKNWLYERIENSRLTKDVIRFTDQAPNQRMARVSSMIRDNATLDLSEASDRVSLALVLDLFRSNKILLDLILASRTEVVTLPSGLDVSLNKFASMGSALCFPVEALVFMCIIQVALHKKYSVSRPTPESIACYNKQLSVYGDDLIVPSNDMECVVNSLTTFGLKVNETKSFKNSHFRESCGSEWYAGHDVRPIYLREDPFSVYSSPSQLASFFATVHQLYDRGNLAVVEELRSDYESGRILPGLPYRYRHLPYVPVLSGYIGWPSHDYVSANLANPQFELRYDDRLQKSYTPIWSLSGKSRHTISGWRALFRWFTECREYNDFRFPDSKSYQGSSSRAAPMERDRDWRREHDRQMPMSLRRGKLYV